jgi:hypothetical protein
LTGTERADPRRDGFKNDAPFSSLLHPFAQRTGERPDFLEVGAKLFGNAGRPPGRRRGSGADPEIMHIDIYRTEAFQGGLVKAVAREKLDPRQHDLLAPALDQLLVLYRGGDLDLNRKKTSKGSSQNFDGALPAIREDLHFAARPAKNPGHDPSRHRHVYGRFHVLKTLNAQSSSPVLTFPRLSLPILGCFFRKLAYSLQHLL